MHYDYFTLLGLKRVRVLTLLGRTVQETHPTPPLSRYLSFDELECGSKVKSLIGIWRLDEHDIPDTYLN